MTMRWMLAGALLLAGCGTAPREPGWVRWTPEAPPPEQVELHGPPVEAGQGWITGHWMRTDAGWAWHPGTFVAPAGPNVVWIPGCWVGKNGQWVWVEGGWR